MTPVNQQVSSFLQQIKKQTYDTLDTDVKSATREATQHVTNAYSVCKKKSNNVAPSVVGKTILDIMCNYRTQYYKTLAKKLLHQFIGDSRDETTAQVKSATYVLHTYKVSMLYCHMIW